MVLKTGKSELQDLTCIGCPGTTVGPEVPQHDYANVYDDRHITT
jgi:hypothetical protein